MDTPRFFGNHTAALAALCLAPLAMAAEPPAAGTAQVENGAPLNAGSAKFPEPDKLPQHPELPDPLVTFSGRAVKTREAWEMERAPELRALFQHYMYGRRPPQVRGFELDAKVIREDTSALGGKATLREVLVNPGLDRPIHLLIMLPNERTKAVACFLGMNFNGNYALLDDPLMQTPAWVPKSFPGAAPHTAADAGRGQDAEAWALDQAIDRGYAVATFFSGDVMPDDKEMAPELLKKWVQENQEPNAGDNTATIMVWAWGFSRMLDYLLTVPEIDAKRIAAVGHSRNGKTALLAAAFDERFAMVVPTQAGCGGSAPSRLPAELLNPPDGKLIHETVKRINTAFPHWFCANFKAFNDAPDRLPFDQHCLIALCAPRPVLLSCATGDQWANPAGQFEMLRAADPVYKLLAGDGLGAAEMPPEGKLIDSRLGYYIRPGKHSMTREDWKVWLDYADKWMK
jgi:dienelactone hydrolase